MFAVVMLLVVTSCSKTEQKIESHIPADAMLVAKIDVPTLVKNLGFEVKDNALQGTPRVYAALADLGVNADEMMGEASKTLNSGIDFSGSAFFYMLKGENDDHTSVFLLPVKDEAKLLTYLSDEAGVNLEDKSGVKVAYTGGTGYALKDGVLYCAPEKSADDVVGLVAAPVKAMNTNAEIVKALAPKNDVNVYVNVAQLKETLMGALPSAGGSQVQFAKSLLDIMDVKSGAYHLSFADNKCCYSQENVVDDNSDYAKLAQTITAEPSADLLPLMPKAANAAVFAVNINGEGIANLDAVKNLLALAGDSPEMKKMLDIFKSINGPLNIGVACETLSADDLDAVFAFKCGKASDLLEMLKQTLPPSMYTVQGDTYVFNEPLNGFKASLTVKGDAVSIKMAAKEYSDNLASVSEAKSLVGGAVSSVYCTMTLDNKQMLLCLNGKNIKQGDASLVVTENGKNVTPIEAIAFLVKLSEKVKALSPS